jgi:phosphoribosylanthranilate isomerase
VTGPGGPAGGPAVKICGICSAGDAALAAAAGADYLGVILVPGRSRSRTLEEAAAILSAAPGVRRVGVFVDPAPGDVLEAAALLRLDVVQFHGDEGPALLRAVRAALPVAARPRLWKALRVREPGEIVQGVRVYASVADGLLLEGWSERGHGGVGARFDWTAAATPRAALPPGLELVVAGGLDPGNVAEAVRLLRPHVVDVSSGVEAAPCRKSAQRVHAFIAAAREAALRRDTDD